MKPMKHLQRDVPLFRQKSILDQLSFTGEHCREWIDAFDDLLDVTRAAAPARTSGHRPRVRDPFGLGRSPKDDIDPANRERRIEQALWEQWNRRRYQESNEWFLPAVCKGVAAYQVPLQETSEDKGWGRIDFVGVGARDLPVVGELKKEDGDTPLWMLAEAFGYALSLQRAWEKGDLRQEWSTAVLTASADSLPTRLDSITVLCAAPEPYWITRIGSRDIREANRVPPEAWPAFLELVETCRAHGFSVEFVSFQVDESIPGSLRILRPAIRLLPGQDDLDRSSANRAP
jgi:hypothetical protein